MPPAETSFPYGHEAVAIRIAFAMDFRIVFAEALFRAMALAPLHRDTPALTTSAALPSREGLGLLWEQRPYGESQGTSTDPLKRLAPRDAAIGQSCGQVVEVGRTLRRLLPCGSAQKGSIFRFQDVLLP